MLGEAFRQKVTPATIAAYELGLDDIAPNLLKQAAQRAIRECEFMPTAAKLRQLAVGQAPDAKDVATLAWLSVVDAVSTVGSYRHVDFSDPLVNATIRHMGGWPELCQRPTKEFDVWVRKEFLTVYESFSRTGVSDEAMKPLPGLAESGGVARVNGEHLEFVPPQPVRVSVGIPRKSSRRPSPCKGCGELACRCGDRETLPKDVPRIELRKVRETP